MKVDYIAMMQKYHGSRNDGFLTDAPKPIQLADDDYVRVRYDEKFFFLFAAKDCHYKKRNQEVGESGCTTAFKSAKTFDNKIHKPSPLTKRFFIKIPHLPKCFKSTQQSVNKSC